MKKLLIVFFIFAFSFYCNTKGKSDEKKEQAALALLAISAGNGNSGNGNTTTNPTGGADNNNGSTGTVTTGNTGVTTPLGGADSNNGSTGTVATGTGNTSTSGNSNETTAAASGSGTTATAINLTSELQRTKVADHHAIFQAVGTGNGGTLVLFSGHEHETDPSKLPVQPVFQFIWERMKNKYSKCVYIGLSAGQRVKPRYNDMKTYIFSNVVGGISIVDLSAGSLYGEFFQEDAIQRGFEVIRVDIAGISKGIIFTGFTEVLAYLSSLVENTLGITTIPPDWQDYLPESELIAEVQTLRKKNAGPKNFCVGMNFFNSGNDTLTTIESACSEIPDANRTILAGLHDVNANQSTVQSVTETVAYILDNEKSPDKSVYPLASLWSNGLFASLLPALPGLSLQPTFEAGVPGLKVAYEAEPWKINLSAKATNVNLVKNLVDMSGVVDVWNTRENKKIIAQNVTGEVVYDWNNYVNAGKSSRISGFENYPYYFRGTAKAKQECISIFFQFCMTVYEQSPLTYIDVMDVKAPVHVVNATLGIKNHKNFKVAVDINGHWQKDETWVLVPVHRTIDVSSPDFGISYTNGYPTLTGSLVIAGYGLGLDDVDTTCVFQEKEVTEDYIIFTSPQKIKANILGFIIGESSCSALVGGDIKVPRIK